VSKVIAVIKWRKLREKLKKTIPLKIRINRVTKLIRIQKFASAFKKLPKYKTP
jgi:hypothetical protein